MFFENSQEKTDQNIQCNIEQIIDEKCIYKTVDN